MTGLGGMGPGGGLGGLGGIGGGGFDPRMFGPDFYDPGSNKDKADGGNRDTSGTGAQAGGDDTTRGGVWSGTGIKSSLEW